MSLERVFQLAEVGWSENRGLCHKATDITSPKEREKPHADSLQRECFVLDFALGMAETCAMSARQMVNTQMQTNIAFFVCVCLRVYTYMSF